MKIIAFLAGILMWCGSFAQTDSCHLRISILTCGYGEDLYTAWGHTAVRVTDPVSNTDIIYNYGTFNFEDPDFYIKFVKGQLLYFVSVEKFQDFMYEYRLDGREVIEQVLNLSCKEKARLNRALQTNAKDENKYYFYQFLFDNCSTRVKHIVQANTESPLTFDTIPRPPHATFRTLIHADLDHGEQQWSKLGIDLSLGSLIDRAPTNAEMMFLPEYLLIGFDKAHSAGHPLVASKLPLLHTATPPATRSIFNPANVFTAVLIFTLLLGLVKQPWTKRFFAIFDVNLFFLIGGVGIFLLFLWFGTGHDLTANNYNLLWALPTHLIISFFVQKDKRWVRTYFRISVIITALVILFWAFLPQGMNPAFLPLVALLAWRSFVRSQFRKGSIA